MYTSLAAGKVASDSRRSRENCRHPGGDNHEFEPRPLPAIWCVANESIGTGSCDRSLEFLFLDMNLLEKFNGKIMRTSLGGSAC